VHETVGTDRTRTPIRITEEDGMPAMCSSCGHHTLRQVEVRRSVARKTDQTASTGVHVFGLLGLFGTLAGWLYLWRSRRKEVVIWLPQCKLCAAAEGTPQPRYVDFDNHRMTFVVHQNFQEARLKLTGP
jgi:hypothetical protein